MISYFAYSPIVLKADYNLEDARQDRNESEVWKFCRQHTLISLNEQTRWHERQSLDPSIKMFGIYRDPFPRQIGICGFTSIDYLNRNAEFSLYIRKDARGCNYGENALKSLVRHGFEDWGFNRIWGEVFDFNEAGKSIFNKIGFRKEGTLRETYWKKGRFIDSDIISILAREAKV